MTTKYSYIITEDSLTLHGNGKSKTIHSTHEQYEIVKSLVRKSEFEQAFDAMDLTDRINKFGKGKVVVENGIVKYNNTPVHSSLTRRILQMQKEGFDIEPLSLFLENLMSNPRAESIKELYSFLEHGKLPITTDGHFLAYKCVSSDFRDLHTKKIDNSVGTVVKMDRGLVDDRRNVTCSTGLHICSLEYLRHFGNGTDIIVIVKVNPRDVVSIPNDYSDTKARVCEYLVQEVLTVGKVKESAFTRQVQDSVHDLEDDSFEDSFQDDDWDDSLGDEKFDEWPTTTKSKPKPSKFDGLVGSWRKYKSTSTKFQILSIGDPRRDSKGQYTGTRDINILTVRGKYSTDIYPDILHNSIPVDAHKPRAKRKLVKFARKKKS